MSALFGVVAFLGFFVCVSLVCDACDWLLRR
jgi:hypothetical protein